MTTTKKQHYVFRKYLSSWSHDLKTNGQIWCYLKDSKKIIRANLKDIANQRYFYELHELNDLEMIVLSMYSKLGNNIVPHDGHLDTLHFVKDTENIFNLFPDDNKNTKEKGMANFRRQAGEELQSFYESLGIEYLEKITDRSVDFFMVESERKAFLVYLFMQYFRTKTMKERIVSIKEMIIMGRASFGANLEKYATPLKEEGIHVSLKKARAQLYEFENSLRIDRIVPYVIEHLTNVFATLFSVLKPMRMELLITTDNSRFISCDQPIFNIKASTQYEEVKEHLFFHPISPTLAIQLVEDDVWRTHIIKVSSREVCSLNDQLLRFCHSQIYASQKEDLEHLIKV